MHPRSTPSVAQRVIAEIAAAEGTPDAALSPPLYSVIDPDALDAMFPVGPHARTGSTVELSFQYGGYRVSVRSTPSQPDGSDVMVTVRDSGAVHEA
jgi:hypothetical protein